MRINPSRSPSVHRSSVFDLWFLIVAYPWIRSRPFLSFSEEWKPSLIAPFRVGLNESLIQRDGTLCIPARQSKKHSLGFRCSPSILVGSRCFLTATVVPSAFFESKPLFLLKVGYSMLPPSLLQRPYLCRPEDPITSTLSANKKDQTVALEFNNLRILKA